MSNLTNDEFSNEYNQIEGISIIELPLIEAVIANAYADTLSRNDPFNSAPEILRPSIGSSKALYWIERSAEQGYPPAQRYLVQKQYGEYGQSPNPMKAYMWAYIGDLYKDYEQDLRVKDVDIRRNKIYKRASKYDLEFVHTSDVLVKLSAERKAQAEEEARVLFEKIRYFMDAQIEAYKAEHNM